MGLTKWVLESLVLGGSRKNPMSGYETSLLVDDYPLVI